MPEMRKAPQMLMNVKNESGRAQTRHMASVKRPRTSKVPAIWSRRWIWLVGSVMAVALHILAFASVATL